MNVITLAKRFLRRESGAVTVDWVVMTAAVVGLCFAALTSITSGVDGTGNSTENKLKHVAKHLGHDHD